MPRFKVPVSVTEKLPPILSVPNVKPLISTTETLFAPPVLVSDTAPVKLLFPAPTSVIAAPPVVTLVIPPITSVEPAPCVTAPAATTVKFPPFVLIEPVPVKVTAPVLAPPPVPVALKIRFKADVAALIVMPLSTTTSPTALTVSVWAAARFGVAQSAKVTVPVPAKPSPRFV